MMMRHNGISLHRTKLYHTGLNPSIGNVHNLAARLMHRLLVQGAQSAAKNGLSATHSGRF